MAADPLADIAPELIGRWEGTGRLWWNGPPDPPAFEEPVTATIEPVLAGRWLRHEYETTIDGVTHSGTALVGTVPPRAIWQIAWIDSFHTSGSGAMLSEGPIVRDGPIDVLGSYPDGDGVAWGWRTELAPAGADALRIRHWNVTPDGQAALAVEFAYTRA